EKIAAETELGAALQGLNTQAEADAELKANQNFLQLQNEVSDIVNKLAVVRRYCIAATIQINNTDQKCPNVFFSANICFKTEAMFDLGVSQRQQLDQAPEVKF